MRGFKTLCSWRQNKLSVIHTGGLCALTFFNYVLKISEPSLLCLLSSRKSLIFTGEEEEKKKKQVNICWNCMKNMLRKSYINLEWLGAATVHWISCLSLLRLHTVSMKLAKLVHPPINSWMMNCVLLAIFQYTWGNSNHTSEYMRHAIH